MGERCTRCGGTGFDVPAGRPDLDGGPCARCGGSGRLTVPVSADETVACPTCVGHGWLRLGAGGETTDCNRCFASGRVLVSTLSSLEEVRKAVSAKTEEACQGSTCRNCGKPSHFGTACSMVKPGALTGTEDIFDVLQKAEEVMQRLGYAAFLRGEDARTTACRDIASSLRRVREYEAKRLQSVEVSNDPSPGLTFGPR